MRGDDARYLSHEALRLAENGLRRFVRHIGIERGECRHAGAQNVHRVTGRDEADDLNDGFGQGASRSQASPEGLELALIRQPAVQQEVAHFLEAAVEGEIVDGVTAVEEDALLAVDEAGLRLVHEDVAQPLG